MTTYSLDALRRTLLNGEPYIVSFSGNSQYSVGRTGSSSCGLAALNCARTILQKERQGVRGWDLLREMTSPDMFDAILGVCANWSSAVHLDVEDVWKTPIFSTTLDMLWSDYDQAGLQQFQRLLSRLQLEESHSTSLIITRPPEVVSVVKICTDSTPVFATFDSHPRQKHPNGAAFIMHPSLYAAARYLTDLLQYDPVLLADPTLQWQAQLLSHYSAHMFSAIGAPTSPGDIASALLDASFEILSLRAQVNELNNRLKTKEWDDRQPTHVEGYPKARSPDYEGIQARAHVQPASTSRPLHTDSSSRIPAYPPTAIPKETVNLVSSASRAKGKLVFHTVGIEDDDAMFATRIRLEWRKENDQGILPSHNGQHHVEESSQLQAHLGVPEQDIPANLECGICLESHDESAIVRIIKGCEHEFCRICILSYVRSQIKERRFPISCPVCMAEKDATGAGTIDSSLVQMLELSEEELSLFYDMELAAFSVPLRCNGCQRTASVDREEYDAQTIIACPLPGCYNVWCKNCSVAVVIGGPRHSCDGTSELNHLINEEGWKYCPGCRTPVSKVEGCNHMTCISPGCNTHFCYLCAEIIIKSLRRNEIKRAITAHYSRCHLLDNHI